MLLRRVGASPLLLRSAADVDAVDPMAPTGGGMLLVVAGRFEGRSYSPSC